MNKRVACLAFTPPLAKGAACAATAAALAVALTCPLSTPLPLFPNTTVHAAAIEASSGADTEHALAAEAWAIVRAHHVGNVSDTSVLETEATRLRDAPLRTRIDTYDAIRGALRRLSDRQERLLEPRDMEALRRFGSASVGIRLELGENGKLIIENTPAPGTAAAEAGLKAGDTVLAINGVSIARLGRDEANNLLEQGNGRAMRIETRQAGEVELIARYSGKRARGGYKPVRSSVIEDNGRNVGYIRVAELRDNVGDDVKRAIETLSEGGADSWILDIRGNRGGSFETALGLARVLLEPGTSVAVVDQGAGGLSTYTAQGDQLSGISLTPLAVVVDKETSGEAEMLASALGSQRCTVVVGERTSGRTGVQAVFPISDGSGLVLTVAEMRGEDGRRIQGRGVEPELPMSATSKEKVSLNWDKIICRAKEE